MSPETVFLEASQSTALSPARAVLAAAIDALDSARDRLAELHSPLSALEQALLAAQSVEAAELRSEISRLLRTYPTQGNAPNEGDASLERPLSASGLVEAEQSLTRLVKGAADAEYQLAAARGNYVAAAECLRIASTEREEALWPAVVEAAEPDLYELEEGIRRVLVIEARLRGLVSALREVAHRAQPGAAGGFTAAEKIETKITQTRRNPAAALDIETGRSFIERLRSDPRATL